MKERKDKTESLAYLVTGVLLVAVAVKPPRWLCQIYAILERAIVLLLGLVMAAAGLVSLARPRQRRPRQPVWMNRKEKPFDGTKNRTLPRS